MAVIYKICGCGTGYNPQAETHYCAIDPGYRRPAALSKQDRPVVFENPQTGEVRYPARQDSPMMPGYKERGFERREFTSYREHQDWCSKQGVINHAAEGIK